MIIENLFANTIGRVLLIAFCLLILVLLVWLLMEKKEKDTEKEEMDYEQSESNLSESANEVNKLQPVEDISVYEIVEIEGSFKVRKKGSERTIRKFATKEEAANYVKEKER